MDDETEAPLDDLEAIDEAGDEPMLGDGASSSTQQTGGQYSSGVR
jgi:hypothetical protein